MASIFRKATANDATRWLDLLKAVFGEEYPDKQVYDPQWVTAQLSSPDNETWVAENAGKFMSSLTFLPPLSANHNPIANIGRHLNRPESFQDGSAEGLLKKATSIVTERKQMAVNRILASDNQMQAMHEKEGYACVGFQPFKHMLRARESCLFYVKLGREDDLKRLPISESLPQITELASAALMRLNLGNPIIVRDGVTGYPLQSEVKMCDATIEDFELWRTQATSVNPPLEISGLFNQGLGYLRNAGSDASKAFLAQKDGKFIAGVAYIFDNVDRCLRIHDSFSQDDVTMGALFNHAVKVAQTQYSSVYVEVDVLATAPRLIKSAEQLGFVPIAYLPGFYFKDGKFADVAKMIKLNMGYSQDNTAFTTHSRAIAEIIDHSFQDQKMGVAIINLLRALPFFEGLGDGELRKIARLFTQKLFRAGEKIFSKGDSGNEAYVVMRGQIDILLEEGAKPIASMANGQIFGELAFLDGSPRTAIGQAAQPSILLVVQRSAFNDLVQHEPHLGMVVMKNIAMELSNRLRKTNSAMMSKK